MVNHMVKRQEPLGATFAALADPTRRAILARLESGHATVTELAEPFDVSLPAISRHLRVLERAGLLVRNREGRTHRMRSSRAPARGGRMVRVLPSFLGEATRLAGPVSR